MSTELIAGSIPAEKPHHYTYLKEFRTSQCPLFLQHKCTQHRPFTCFNWHFMNQRRRRPVRKRDGTFSYSPDHYCAKYDETTGICPDGEDCIYLHRTTGDTERRYHLRYYKTGTCVHETDAKGNCTKNGPHCAFAHGAHDLRQALFDIREVQSMETTDHAQMTPVGTPSSLEKDRMLLDDPHWNDTTFILACYKTEPCKRPPRLCRQGYACPQFHNSRDRRRSPKKYKYRSTPCPHVKHGDDWGDPGQCDTGDDCSYCHTRTEQQFHPEIYKSTKCNDMSQTAYCPRGPFCAFAHVDQEMTGPRDLHMGTDNSLAAFVSNVLPNMPDIPPSQPPETSSRVKVLSASWGERGLQGMGGVPQQHQSSASVLALHQRGSLRVRHHSQTEVDCRHHSLLFGLGELAPSSASPLPTSLTPPQNAVISNHATTFYPAADTVESMIGSTLEEMSMDDFDLSSIDKELEKDDTNSMSSSYSAGLSQAYLGATSVPVNIPNQRDNHCRGSLGSLSESPSSPFGSNDHSAHLIVKNSLSRQPRCQLEHKQEQLLEQAAAAFNRQPNPGKYAAAAQPGQDALITLATMSPHSPLCMGSALTSSLIGSHIDTSTMSPTLAGEVQRMREELMTNKAKLHSWEEGISQARNACDAWRKEAEEAITKARLLDEERVRVTHQRDEVLQQLQAFQTDLPCSWLHSVNAMEPLDVLPRSKLQQVRRQLARDCERIDQTIASTTTNLCLSCQEHERTIVLLPCEHFVLCDACINLRQDCPHCHGRIVTTRREN